MKEAKKEQISLILTEKLGLLLKAMCWEYLNLTEVNEQENSRGKFT
jgi:hypothetical protein